MIWACIAARNEAESISALVEDLQSAGLYVAMVDDGSEDGTGALAQSRGAIVVTHPERQGIAASLMDAWRAALSHGATGLLQLDAGGSHGVEDASALIRARADLVIGSRYLAGSGYVGRPWRARASRLAALACSWTTGHAISDWTSGYRYFSADLARYLLTRSYQARMHAWQIEVLWQALRAQFIVREVPILYVAGDSSFRLSTAWEAVKVWGTLG